MEPKSKSQAFLPHSLLSSFFFLMACHITQAGLELTMYILGCLPALGLPLASDSFVLRGITSVLNHVWIFGPREEDIS